MHALLENFLTVLQVNLSILRASSLGFFDSLIRLLLELLLCRILSPYLILSLYLSSSSLLPQTLSVPLPNFFLHNRYTFKSQLMLSYVPQK